MTTSGLRRSIRSCVPALLVLLTGVHPALGAVSTYRWQVQQTGTIGSSGYTASWPAACGGLPDVDNNASPLVTTMSSAAFCGNDRLRNRRPLGPHALFLMIKGTAYAAPTAVSGQATGNRWAFFDEGGGGKTMRLTLGYAQGGAFTGWGSVDVAVPAGTAGLFLPDMSGISGTAPAGSHLALLVTKQVGANNSYVAVYFANQRAGGDLSGEISVDETAAAGNTTTLGDGSDPAASPLCPGDAETVADRFTFVTDGNVDPVTDVTVSLSPAAGVANLDRVRITDLGGAQELGVVSDPATGTLVIPVTGLDATASAIAYEVRIRPKTDAAMDPPPGASYAITAPISAFTPAANTAAGSDDDTEATVVDNASPGNAAWGTITTGDGRVTLPWADPLDADFQEVIIVRKQGGALVGGPTEGQTYAVTEAVGDGTVVFVGTDAASPWTDTGVTNGQSYWYKVFARDAPCVNWSTGAATGPHVPQAPVNEVTPGTPTATSVLCDSVTLSAPFTGDANGDSTTDWGRKAGTDCTGGGYTAVTGCVGVTGPSPRTCIDATAAEQTDYCYEVTFADPDGVLGTNPQTVGPLTTPACAADGTAIVSTGAEASSCNQITVTAIFSGDDDQDGEISVEIDPGGGFQTACGKVTGPSPRQCIVPGLSPGTSYPLRVTVGDPDGVTPDNNLDPVSEQVTPTGSPVSTPACGADDAAPTTLFLTPARNAVLGATDRIKVQVYDAGGLAATDPVQWSVDGDALGTCPAPYCALAVEVNASYDCDWAGEGTCAVYQFDLDTTQLVNGAHYLTLEATDAAGNVARIERAFRVQNDQTSGRAGGHGNLLRRTTGSQVCRDCHNLATHSSQLTDSGYGNWAMECLTCHTPHETANIFLIRETIETPNSGSLAVRFEENATGAVADSSVPGTASFVNEDHVARTDGICQVCHTRTGGATPRWRNKLQSTPNAASHYTTTAGTQPCTDCHVHADGFAGAGGCTGCHFTGGPAVAAGRRPVDDDFVKQSHHVGAGGVAMGGTLTDFDCVVCHSEGTIEAGAPATTTYHNDSDCTGGRPCIDLKNADDTAAVPFRYDKQLLTDTLGGTVNAWSTGSADWETETSTHLDPFCLTCHDADGATQSANQNADEGCSTTPAINFLNPFCDSAVSNDYDRVDRTRVVDIASKVVASAGDLEGPGDPRPPDGRPDPPEGIYSRHAIRGQALSVYADVPDAGIPAAFWKRTNFAWNDNSVMGCADCHTVDGANTTAGNAHGSSSEYLLKNVAGLAVEGDYNADPTIADFTYICYRCHTVGYYSRGQTRNHTDNDGDWAHTANLVGANRKTTGNDGNIFGIACLNCHGGAPSDPPANPTDPVGFGAIHGTSEVFGFGSGGSAGTRRAYRFMNGASLRYYNPDNDGNNAVNDWTDAQFNCFTLGSADNWGACTQHGSGSRTYDRAFTRPLSY